MMRSGESASALQENFYNTWVRRRTAEIKDLRIREIMWKMTSNKRCKILDVGCGDGSLLEPFSKHQDCYGVDISEVQLEKAHDKNVKTFRVNLETEKQQVTYNIQ